MPSTYFIANWKQNHSIVSTKEYINIIAQYNNPNAKIIICPPYPLISFFTNAKLANTDYGSQNLSSELSGAYTGEVSAELLQNFGCKYAIIGHSERRQLYHETDEVIAKKVALAIAHKITPILCVGETISERENNNFINIIKHQIISGLNNIGSQNNIIIAYEPVWAIGTGLVPENEQIEDVFNLIKTTLTDINIEHDKVKILYGGSANTKNLANLLKISSMHGFLIGSASLDAENLIEMADFVK